MSRIQLSALTLCLLAMTVAAKESAPSDVVASAAEVVGAVKVNQGEQFRPLLQGNALREGDRVMALRDGSAVIRFDDGCELRVESETMVEVPAISTCAGAIVSSHAIEPASSGAVGAAGTGGVDWAGVATIVGTVVVGDGILYDEGNNDTVSP